MSTIGIDVFIKCNSCTHEGRYYDLGSTINESCYNCGNQLKYYFKLVPAKKRNRPPIETPVCIGGEFMGWGL